VVLGAGLAAVAGSALAGAASYDETLTGELWGYPRDLDVADVDGDGDLDVVVSDKSSGSQRWLENDGATPPTFTARSYSVGDGTQYYVEVGDINGDGAPDIAAAQPDNRDRIVWFESDGGSPPAFTLREIGGDGNDPYCLTLGDVDGDTDLDVIAHYNESATVWWYENGGGVSPTWTAHQIDAAGGNLRGLDTGDIDGDGDTDVLASGFNAVTVLTSQDDGIFWYENLGGDPPAWAERTIDATSATGRTVFDSELVDLDGDGDLDALAAQYNGGRVRYYENDGATDPSFTLREIGLAGGSCFDVSAADLDGDGDLDVAAVDQGGDGVVWFENVTVTRGSGRALDWSAANPVVTTLDRPELVTAADVTNDGLADLVVGWINQPRTVSIYAVGAPTPGCVADINGDGVTDVFDFADLASDFGAGPGATRAQGDVNGDGFVDVFDFADLASDFGCQE
jgi:hypothetical protein